MKNEWINSWNIKLTTDTVQLNSMPSKLTYIYVVYQADKSRSQHEYNSNIETARVT